MGYQALYRVWRPQRFADLVGQQMVTKTLRNALSTGQTTHAYLFTGPRGTGKTSAAKIFAKALNCHHQKDGEPCNKCETCQAITAGRLNDVIEIDAASNNGVEEIRDIRDKAKYAPTQADYKVYIIDEVHMLSTGAFNALLKTLEEPPKNVVFILATTEPHKIPATIISRTQRFDFKRIEVTAILERMEYILDEKAISYQPEALKVIAKVAEGGMRDALSILDQVISFGDNDVTLENALLVTGSVTNEKLTVYLSQVSQHETPQALKTVHELLADGKSAKRLVEDLIAYCRDMLLYQQAPELLEQNELGMLTENFKTFVAQSSAAKIYRMIDILNEQEENMRFTSHEAVYLEVLTVKLSQLSDQAPEVTNGVQPEVNTAEVNQLITQVQSLTAKVEALQSQGVSTQAAPPKANRQIRQVKSSGPFKANQAQINEVLGQATRADLMAMQDIWPDLLNMLPQQSSSMMSFGKPVAASPSGAVIAFSYDFMPEQFQADPTVQEQVTRALVRLLNREVRLTVLPERMWGQVRQAYIKSHNLKGQAQQAEAETMVDQKQAEETKAIEAAQAVVVAAKEKFGDEIVTVQAD
ncbi:MAG: DNA polymerase III subunit gamma/tau [Ligilactobacillus sp.]|uniref:DNA-directed DNA polymerase n=1 Tax=Ligilactobacillus equi DPC 6820 TaxID=1392007 RepID=V7HZI6_9LACO|nr:DNA polymerase III subunit gamma/tau [Ligilactobacillus equi]ETA74705.1 DNA polymerase III subunits gamma and tau [Ligilactobacillus equi DPC 6820]MCQ2557230.1 DNA polymerase III subunit gamma/tau [Ligilactobacillus sp.]